VACRRGDIDAPIAIRALKRFVIDRYGVEAPLRDDREPWTREALPGEETRRANLNSRNGPSDM